MGRDQVGRQNRRRISGTRNLHVASYGFTADDVRLLKQLGGQGRVGREHGVLGAASLHAALGGAIGVELPRVESYEERARNGRTGLTLCDHCVNGQRLKRLPVTDEFTKEGLAIDVESRHPLSTRDGDAVTVRGSP